MGLIVLSLLLFNNLMIVKTTGWASVPPPGPVALVSGLWLPKPAADGLRAKAAFVARQDSASTLFLTRYAYSVPLLAGRFAPLPVQNAFAETTTNRDFEVLVRESCGFSKRCRGFSLNSVASPSPGQR